MIGRIQQSLQFQGEALRLRAERQQVLASNIANADTPGYKAVDFDFNQALTNATRPAGATRRPEGIPSTAASLIRERPGSTASADGNSVDMDKERAEFLDNGMRHEATLRFLNGRIRSILSAIQGQ
jgi:flagellar basal-body rod protein FlgB